MIISRSPYRITLGGGGTDRPDFYERHGGFVISMALDKYIYVTLKPDYIEKEIKVRYLKTEIVNSLSELQHDRAREALKSHGLESSLEILYSNANKSEEDLVRPDLWWKQRKSLTKA